MNIIEKRAEEKIKKNRLSKEQKNRLENTKKFNKKFSVKIIDNRIDFLTIKILNLNSELNYLKNNIKTVYPYEFILGKDVKIEKLINTKKILDKFYIINSGFAFGNQKIIYSIYDLDKNKIGQITFKNESEIKTNKNIINSIELKGLFFKCYHDYLLVILEFFGIDFEIQDIIKRIDYCIDIQGIEPYELLEYIKDIYKNSKTVNSLTAEEIKKLKENNTDIKKGRKETYKNFFSTHNDLKIYDKILDILENYKTRKVDGKNPYADYLNSDFPITRIELKKKKFNNLTDNSLNWVFNNIEALFFDYLLRYFDLDLSLYAGVDKTLNGKKIFLAKEEKSKNLYHSITMLLAYARNIEELTSKENLFKILLNKYPELEKLSSLSLLDEFETHEFLNELFPKK